MNLTQQAQREFEANVAALKCSAREFAKRNGFSRSYLTGSAKLSLHAQILRTAAVFPYSNIVLRWAQDRAYRSKNHHHSHHQTHGVPVYAVAWRAWV